MNENAMNYQPELITAPVSVDDISPVGNNIYTEICDGSIEVTAVDDGRGCLIRLWSAHGVPVDLENGKRYRLRIDVRQTVGSNGKETISWWDTKEWHQLSEIWATHQFNFTASSNQANHYIRFSMNGGDKIEFRNVLLKELP